MSQLLSWHRRKSTNASWRKSQRCLGPTLPKWLGNSLRLKSQKKKNISWRSETLRSAAKSWGTTTWSPLETMRWRTRRRPMPRRKRSFRWANRLSIMTFSWRSRSRLLMMRQAKSCSSSWDSRRRRTRCSSSPTFATIDFWKSRSKTTPFSNLWQTRPSYWRARKIWPSSCSPWKTTWACWKIWKGLELQRKASFHEKKRKFKYI